MAKKKKRKDIVVGKAVDKQRIVKNNNQKEGTNGITFNFEYPNWLKGVRTKEFSNYLVDDNEFNKNIVYILHELIPIITKEGLSQSKHSHEITEKPRKKIKKVLQEIHGNSFAVEEIESLWQLGIKGGIRLICLRKENVFTPVLIDHHHKLYESQKHNQNDTKNYSYCPIDSYKR